MTRYSLFCGRDPVALGIEDETGGWSLDALRAHIETCPICRCGTERLTEAMDMSLAAAVLGKSRSPQKTAASRANGAKGGRPRVKGELDATLHRDGTVTYWSVYEQRWVKRGESISLDDLAAMSREERERVMRHLGMD